MIDILKSCICRVLTGIYKLEVRIIERDLFLCEQVKDTIELQYATFKKIDFHVGIKMHRQVALPASSVLLTGESRKYCYDVEFRRVPYVCWAFISFRKRSKKPYRKRLKKKTVEKDLVQARMFTI